MVANVKSLISDPSPFISRDNNTATLRISMQEPQVELRVERDHSGGSVLNGIALLGGIWTSLNFAFAAIFGSTLLLVLFGTFFTLALPVGITLCGL